jgi:23S rRNA (uridine2552-2'-O)-methyltransferase
MVKRSEVPHDRYYRAAKQSGYRSRSAYKLLQLVAKFKLIKAGDAVVDLGAAPGGWSQVALEQVGERGLVVSVDLQPIARLDEVITLEGDITNDEETVPAIKEALAAHGRATADVVISDAAPHLTGTKDYDQFRSFELSMAALRIAAAVLKPGGHFAAKIFQGSYYQQFYEQVRTQFGETRASAPEATRKRSAEVYVVGKKFGALK